VGAGSGKSKVGVGGKQGPSGIAGKQGPGVGAGQLGKGPGKGGFAGGLGGGPGKAGLAGGPGRVAGAGRGPVVVLRQGPYRFWYGGRWVTFVAATSLAAVLVGADYWYPWGYVSVARPYCAGISENGCRLRWEAVPLVEGGEQVMCVQYCPRRIADTGPAMAAPVATAPAQQASFAEAPPRGRCELVLYADQGLGGLSAPTSTDQPTLQEAGWKNEIGSIEVKAGTWDFFTEDNYAGPTMRLSPGAYRDLGPDWAKKIGSFNCVNPDS
jgi:hypothetical protein